MLGALGVLQRSTQKDMDCLNTIYMCRYPHNHAHTNKEKHAKFELVKSKTIMNHKLIRNEELFYLESNKVSERENRMIQRV